MKHLLLFFILLDAFRLQAHSERYSIKVTVTDTLGDALPFATTMLLHPVDSTLITLGRTDEKGVLEFTNLKRESYLLKINCWIHPLPCGSIHRKEAWQTWGRSSRMN